MEIISNRIFQNEKKTLSILGVFDPKLNRFRERLAGIELPWNNNQRGISCFPADTYNAEAVFRHSQRHLPDTDIRKYGIWIKNIPGRSSIVIHIANFVRDLEGCIAPGLGFRDIDRDGILDVTDSGDALMILKRYFPVGTQTTIRVFDFFKMEGNINPVGYNIAKHEFRVR